MFHLKKDDKVKVISGKHKGRMGKVLAVFPDKRTALVERVNFVKRHMKAGSGAGQQGGIIEKEAPLPLSNLMVVCPKCEKPARSGLRELEDGSRVRFCKRCDEQIDT
jgi:large subunit ribosomal protein L24